jgi:hypothetical protein
MDFPRPFCSLFLLIDPSTPCDEDPILPLIGNLEDVAPSARKFLNGTCLIAARTQQHEIISGMANPWISIVGKSAKWQNQQQYGRISNVASRNSLRQILNQEMTRLAMILLQTHANYLLTSCY